MALAACERAAAAEDNDDEEQERATAAGAAGAAPTTSSLPSAARAAAGSRPPAAAAPGAPAASLLPVGVSAGRKKSLGGLPWDAELVVAADDHRHKTSATVAKIKRQARARAAACVASRAACRLCPPAGFE